MAKSTTPTKPDKPYDGFPLFPHATKRWAKKIRGKLCYFGSWDDGWEKALEKYQQQRDDLHAGRKPRDGNAGPELRDLLNSFRASKDTLLEAGELSPRTVADYADTCDRLAEHFGAARLLSDLRPDDFEGLRRKMAKTMGPVSLSNEINRIRVTFKHGVDTGILDRPMLFGPTFKRPSKKTLRKARQEKGPRLLESSDLQTIIDKAHPALKAMTLLAVNCGFGNSDVAGLPLSALNLDGGFVNFPRPKTAIERRCPLWPETVKAIRAWLLKRKEPTDKTLAGLVFVTRRGTRYSNADKCDCAVSKEFAKLLKALGLHKPGRSFYSLRHQFQTIGDEAGDPVATSSIMGHSDPSMAAVYREGISDARLLKVTDHVRKWLYPKAKAVRKAKAK